MRFQNDPDDKKDEAGGVFTTSWKFTRIGFIHI